MIKGNGGEATKSNKLQDPLINSTSDISSMSVQIYFKVDTV